MTCLSPVTLRMAPFRTLAGRLVSDIRHPLFPGRPGKAALWALRFRATATCPGCGAIAAGATVGSAARRMQHHHAPGRETTGSQGRVQPATRWLLSHPSRMRLYG